MKKLIIKSIYAILMFLLMINAFLNILDYEIASITMSSLLLIASFIAFLKRKEYPEKCISIIFSFFGSVFYIVRIILLKYEFYIPFISPKMEESEIIINSLVITVLAGWLELDHYSKKIKNKASKKYILAISGMLSLGLLVLLVWYVLAIINCFKNEYNLFHMIVCFTIIEFMDVIIRKSSFCIDSDTQRNVYYHCNKSYLIIEGISICLIISQYKFNYMNNIVFGIILCLWFLDKGFFQILGLIIEFILCFIFKKGIINNENSEEVNDSNENKNLMTISYISNGLKICPTCSNSITENTIICPKCGILVEKNIVKNRILMNGGYYNDRKK